jgi:diguanylate cyclase (GGDEF)-like protein/PAS domain S-box-containing protein
MTHSIKITGPNQVIIYSIIASVLFAVVDALIDTYLHQSGTFIEVLFLDDEEFFFRLLVTASFLTFGLILSRAWGAKIKVEEALIKSEDRYRSLVDSTDAFIYLVDKDCNYLFMNKRYLTVLGISEKQYIGRTYGYFHSEENTKIFSNLINEVFKDGKSISNEYCSKRNNSYYLQTLSPVINNYGNVEAVTIISKGINERKKIEEKFRTLSMTDELTGLSNRRSFYTLADQQLKLAKRENRGMYLISADLDNLKAINDTYGHLEGDSVLKEIASILEISYRDSDIIARLGGDEFVILFSELPAIDIETLKKRLKANLDSYNSKSTKSYKLSLSMGISRFDPDMPKTLDELLAEADKLMYEMKKEVLLSYD